MARMADVISEDKLITGTCAIRLSPETQAKDIVVPRFPKDMPSILRIDGENKPVILGTARELDGQR
jgi:hypothetical protein